LVQINIRPSGAHATPIGVNCGSTATISVKKPGSSNVQAASAGAVVTGVRPTPAIVRTTACRSQLMILFTAETYHEKRSVFFIYLDNGMNLLHDDDLKLLPWKR
jgi:hypothetical protein